MTEPFTPFLPAPFFEGAPPRAAVSAAAMAARDPSVLGATGAAAVGGAGGRDGAAAAAAAELTGWRDPFIVARPDGAPLEPAAGGRGGGNGCCNGASPNSGGASASNDTNSGANPFFWCIVGAGARGAAGTALLYRSRSVHSGWEFAGELARDGRSRMFECPLLVALPPRRAGTAAASAAGAAGASAAAGGSAGDGGDDSSSHAAGGGAGWRPHLFSYSADYCANGEGGGERERGGGGFEK